MPTDFQKSLANSQRAFRAAAIYDVYIDLKLNQLLIEPTTAEDLARKLNLNANALKRFLHALASLGLIQKFEDEKFKVNPDEIKYFNTASLTLFTLIRNKVPDFLAGKPRSIEEIGDNFTTDQCNQLLLEHSVQYELLARNDSGHYSIPESTKKYLLSSSPSYIGKLVEYLEKIALPSFSQQNLKNALKTGKSQWLNFFGNNTDVSQPFSMYAKEANFSKLFTLGLHKLTEEDNQALVKTLKLNNVRTVLDVGGGCGGLAIELLKQFNSITRIDIYDLPDGIPLMTSIFHENAPNEYRVKFTPGTFLQQTQAGNLEGLGETQLYDLITLAWILHDWSDEINLQILHRVYFHLKPNGQLLILEAILPENRIGPETISDITMLLHTEGRERTFKEYQKLLEQVGFREISWTPTNTRRQAILAIK